jgi:hypothetical protein
MSLQPLSNKVRWVSVYVALLGIPVKAETGFNYGDQRYTTVLYLGSDLLDHSIGEIFLLGIAAHVLERQHRN